MEFSLNDIQSLSIHDDKITVKYKDGTTNTILNHKENEVKFICDLKTNIDAPIVDHCI
jgi:hypothetical protein